MNFNESKLENERNVPVDETETETCRVLWLSVILQKLSDTLSKVSAQ